MVIMVLHIGHLNLPALDVFNTLLHFGHLILIGNTEACLVFEFKPDSIQIEPEPVRYDLPASSYLLDCRAYSWRICQRYLSTSKFNHSVTSSHFSFGLSLQYQVAFGW